MEHNRNREAAEGMSENKRNTKGEKINEENKLVGEGHYKVSRSYIRT